MRLCAGPGGTEGTSSGGRGANELSEPLKNWALAAADSAASHMPVATTSWPPDAHRLRFSAAIAANSSHWRAVCHHCGPCARRNRGPSAAQVAAAFRRRKSSPPLRGSAMADALELLKTRRSIKPVELVGPGPSKAEIETLLTIASRVPDHGKLVPWRFIIFEDAARLAAGDAIAAAFCAKYPQAKPEHIQAERARLARAPLVIAVVSRAAPHVKIPEWEQVLSTVRAGSLNGTPMTEPCSARSGSTTTSEWRDSCISAGRAPRLRTGPAPRSMRSPPASEAASFRFASLPSAKLRRIYWSESARAGSSRALHFALR